MATLSTAAEVLRLFAQGNADVGVAELGERLRLPRSTSSRVLARMASTGLLDRDPVSRRYRVGSLLLDVARRHGADRGPGALAHEALALLSRETGHNGYVSFLDGTETVVLQRTIGSQAIQVVSPPGARKPAFWTSMGRALLSRLTDAEFAAGYGTSAKRLLAPPLRRGPRSVGDLAVIVAQARRDRFAEVIDTGLPGIAAVATTLQDPRSDELVGVCLAFPSHGVERAEIRRLRVRLVDEVARIGRRLGDPWWTT